ncbi:hypothetical protein [Flavitalea sp. BT771]|nr:hypothetical protein [Flavitalea sp. BT771]MDV6220537.1 hypothetical protein [Flavitalea sp. BT771]
MLKKITAILLLGLFLFNWAGYRLLTLFLEARADLQLQVQLDDNNYEVSQLVSLKVPVTHLSYYNNSKEFETVNGSIEMNGVRYKYVKRRIYNDSLEVLCIPDAATMQLKAAKNIFFAAVNGLRHTGTPEKKQSANANVAKDFTPEYYATQDLLLTMKDIWISLSKRYANSRSPLSSMYALVPEHPPKPAAPIA